MANKPPITNENDVPVYHLPDPLLLSDGSKVKDVDSWIKSARPHLLELFRTHVYGHTPQRRVDVHFEVFDEAPNALDGKAIRRQVRATFGSKDGPAMDILIYLPKDSIQPIPVFTGLNFKGNHAVHLDSAIKLPDSLLQAGATPENLEAKKMGRGASAFAWPVETIIEKGYGLATVYREDLDPDYHDGFQNGIHPLFYADGQTSPAADEWGTIGAWAFGLSRVLDYLETDEQIDANRVAVIGHSRLGKAALWAGAQDTRFAMVVSNNSGCGGAALSRRCFGETVERINARFPHWFCGNFKQYNDNEDTLPVDQHMLIALIAPRPVYVGSSSEDLWADPKGEFLAAKEADPVFRLFGTDGLAISGMPNPGEAVHSTIGYHLKPGKHGLTEWDWERYLKFADLHMS